jgi:hypothetical protein
MTSEFLNAKGSFKSSGESSSKMLKWCWVKRMYDTEDRGKRIMRPRTSILVVVLALLWASTPIPQKCCVDSTFHKYEASSCSLLLLFHLPMGSHDTCRGQLLRREPCSGEESPMLSNA